MPKIVDVADKETGETLRMTAINAREAVDRDPDRYSVGRGGRAAIARKPARKAKRRGKAKPDTGGNPEPAGD